MKFIMLINVKMPTTECFKQEKFVGFQYFTSFEKSKFHARVEHAKSFLTLRARMSLHSMVRVKSLKHHKKFAAGILNVYPLP